MYSYDELYRFVEKALIKMGAAHDMAKRSAEVLVTADLRGVDSHGIARLRSYVRLWESGRINLRPEISIVHETPGTAAMDGDSGLGLMVGPTAMALAIEKAKTVGTGWVAVRNSSHYGIAGYHAMLALAHDMIGISMTNSSPLVAPTFSREKMLGTNPIAVAVPADKEPPLVADFATTPVAYGKIENQMRKGEDLPPGWMQDADGNATTDAHISKKGGALLPLGSDRTHGSHKGYCLSAIVDIFSAVLSGANYGPFVPPFFAYQPAAEETVGAGIGHFFGAIRVDAFRPAAVFKSHMDKWIGRFRKAKPAEGHEKVLIPGDPEREEEIRRREQGIPLLDAVVEDIQYIAEKFELDF
jgi:LDH2 family malate/lactate/ureidoglycolate dehydrogenase